MGKAEDDLSFGLANEIEVRAVLRGLFGGELKKLANKYSCCDFYSNKILVELKSRRIKKDKYQTCFIGLNKIEWFAKQKKECYISYLYEDGLYYIKYDADLFDTFAITSDDINKDGIIKTTLNVKIPTKLLIKIK